MSKPSEQPVVAALDSQVEEIRHRAVSRLPEVFEKIPVKLLLRALGDESWRVRKAAIHLSLLNPPGQEFLDGLTAALFEFTRSEERQRERVEPAIELALEQLMDAAMPLHPHSALECLAHDDHFEVRLCPLARAVHVALIHHL